jgi:hypothetical protein
LSLVLFVIALRYLGAPRTGAYFSTAPFIGSVIAVPLLHETVSVALIAGGVLMAGGVWLHLTKRYDRVHTHETIEHEHVHDEHHQHEHGSSVETVERHTHWHRHEPLTHTHPHFPDAHHRHTH